MPAVQNHARGDRKAEGGAGICYDELPLFLNVETVANVLGIAMSSTYELMKEKDFPALRVGNRLIVPKEKFMSWVEMKTEVIR